MQNAKSLAQSISDKLKRYNIDTLIYHAKATDSVYVKLDYGALNTIRISDHTGYATYAYRYNIDITDNTDTIYTVLNNQYECIFFGTKAIDELINRILIKRAHLIKTYNYATIVKNKKNELKTNKGSWKFLV